jgi:SAM-dependent methyltransferase
LKPETDYLALTLKRWPQIASFALWRAIELRKLSRLQFPAPVLDVGCGNGEVAELLFGAGRRLFGLDLGLTQVSEAARRRVHVGVLQGDATSMPYPADTFGSVLCNCVLEHIPDDRAAVREMGRVVRPGGGVVFTVPGPRFHEGLHNYQALLARGDHEAAAAYLRGVDERHAHLHYRSAEEWRAIAEEAGLRMERVEPYMPGPALGVWDRLESYLTQPVMNVLSDRRLLPVLLLPAALRTWLTYRVLRKYYLMEGGESDLHGGLLIVARKP